MKKEQDDDDDIVVDKVYVYVNDPNESKYQYFTQKRENNNLKQMKDPKFLIWYSNNMLDFYKNNEEHNPGRKCNILIVIDNLIAGMIINKKLHKKNLNYL